MRRPVGRNRHAVGCPGVRGRHRQSKRGDERADAARQYLFWLSHRIPPADDQDVTFGILLQDASLLQTRGKNYFLAMASSFHSAQERSTNRSLMSAPLSASSSAR